MSSTGFAFANPQPSTDNFDEFDPQDVYADSKVQTTPVIEAIPAPWKTPPVLSLTDILGVSRVQEIQKSGKIVFHSAGDTGGIKEPSHQFAVADAMTGDLGGKKYQSDRPAFFYHLGDVVYYFGQERYYYDQFYDPYRDYDAPIFAIPGNHDGELFPSEPVKYSLEAFFNNFCSRTPSHDPALVWVSRLFGHALPGRVNGTDLMERMAALAAERGYSIFLLGATEAIFNATAAEFSRRHPRLKIAGVRNGYFKPEQDDEVLQAINASGADLLLIGISTPKKELWGDRNLVRLGVPICQGAGGSFDVVAGSVSRAPSWMQRCGLEWFYRFLQEPLRLGSRYLRTNPQFLWLVVCEAARFWVLRLAQKFQ